MSSLHAQHDMRQADPNMSCCLIVLQGLQQAFVLAVTLLISACCHLPRSIQCLDILLWMACSPRALIIEPACSSTALQFMHS